ncbi:transcriptional regulator [Corynebacterium sp. sy017]|uniref:helix-turn-helix transcriptional regulator n=1 Tax=unclassified Corynebacterium TaxID=2624378 RepID=UPI0011864DA3|nr:MULTISPECIES: metalloregulator ArsR/SmtB family transcription factor [unclassified Corynebacterium]MBP3087651.1 transcriptional regulator [Corynebacterium sp. sy017]QDZ42643.1 transcriptional regulator [Corynebacterium sp. sy039]TSD92216.1 transcriptional regulator [Corynebacterium sp. SY003]
MNNPVAHADSRSTEGETRRQIMKILLQHGPISAGELGKILGLSATGIRRHLDSLVDNGIAEATDNLTTVRSAQSGKKRGRPARVYRLTDYGRSKFGHHYDVLAAAALSSLKQIGGQQALDDFAYRRATEILETAVLPNKEDAQYVEKAIEAIVAAFSSHGYTASIDNAGQGVQICQHHCPVAHVAAQFPELCQAEHEAISDILGYHVQPLASIADGNGICTTNIPIKAITTDLHSPVFP